MSHGAPVLPVPAPGTRLVGRDWRLLGLALAVALGSLLVAQHYFHRAFPEAAIDFRVSQAQGTPIAEHFLSAYGLQPAEYRRAARFNFDDTAKVFLERELGLERTAPLLATRVHLWRWEYRWFRSLQKEEFRAAVTPQGQLVGFAHDVPEATPGAHLAEAEARQRAESFLTSVLHQDLAQLEFIGSQVQQRPARTDYQFTWKERAPLATGSVSAVMADASYRHEVDLAGDQVSGYHEFLQVPDQWKRDYERLRSRNNTASSVDFGLMMVLALAMLVILVRRVQRSDVKWHTALWVGGVGAVLSTLAAVNQFGLARFNYDTTDSYQTFLARGLVLALLSGLGVGAFLLVLTAAAEPVYRQRFRGQLALSSYLTWPGLRSKSFFLSVALGIALAFFFFAYQTIFYLVANHFGAWAPADVPYDDLLNSRWPWIFVLLGGYFPAIFEEFMFRMLAIPLFEKWFRSLLLAILGAAFLWGFGHSAYPNQPFYIRGVEVGLGGILLSYIMVRFGILTTVVWHYTVDAIYTALLLLRSHNTYLRVSGASTALIAALPLLVAAGAYLRTGHFSDASALTNAAAGTAPPLPAEPEAEEGPGPIYTRVPARRWAIGFLVAVGLLLFFFYPISDWRPVNHFTSTPADAVATARGFLQGQGFHIGMDRADPLPTAIFVDGEAQAAAYYIFHQRSRQALIHELSTAVPGNYWRVRFFQPLRAEEYVVRVRPDGRTVFSFNRLVEDAAPGASPTLAAAQAQVTTFLAAHGLDTQGMELQESSLERRPARTDTRFVWQDADGSPRNLAGVRFRIAATTQGDVVGSFGPSLHVPENQVRAYEHTSPWEIVLTTARVLLLILLLAILFWRLFGFKAAVRWRPVLGLAAAAALIQVIATLNNYRQILAAYNTGIPWSGFVVTLVVGVAVAAVAGALGAVLIGAPVTSTVPLAFALARRGARAQWGRDAALAGLLAAAGLLGWAQCRAVLNARWHGVGILTLPVPFSGLGWVVPGVTEVLQGALQAVLGAGLLAVLVAVLAESWQRRSRRSWVWVGIVLLWLSLVPDGHTAAQFLFGAAQSAVALVLFGLLVGGFLRANPLAYVSALLVPFWGSAGWEYLHLAGWAYRASGATLLGLTAVWLIWLATQHETITEHAT
mgnify:CR=1 FL=1